ncbi:uncharacterized protein [Physcomitrium patens]|uniref:Exostosin GT47 domain-containing protein n=1 Tax=Physcomitrium patens TaxID=3218 RepID=A0A2K1KVT2_PHYPA|nr:exostosin-1c-like [Physcomitrium patens]XP_024372123.1 exostosin-1c-like [Physcomitrium patens]XP_024372124.1 exostosin-1c-like [Physcomitrium patens]XP_024372125.1 exostosin-1c-like [Physcomitrium patens]XP_024372126.1 exostosin-1c-like [Physcomitrium patens]XP_024372127.1 exostosin-1c-like [Physcomitrium patens]XP_024372128.1 exostosin-1c-like [Physcomitrium patens]XP_024372129.1 exostosin-1c-like [Physcomitrium patens]XP_024372130.1 exostosin-1c-like [Physcomitrium patens]XP_02437213|eukprot:XP_024372121.1 exostosin-1c-like [Physcomitrella patens]
MVSSSPTLPPLQRRMGIIIPFIALVVISIIVTLLYGNIASQSCPQESIAPGLPFTAPYTLSVPPGNCNCTVFFPQGSHDPLHPSPPSLYCECLDHAETSSNVTLECPKTDKEIQFVDRKVIKEVAQDCPVCTNDARIIEKEVIKEIGKECPEPVPQIVAKEVVQECPKTPWYAKNRSWHYPASLPLCSMDSCFDYSRCDNADELLIYTYYKPGLEPQRYFLRINESKYHTDDPEKACLFLVPFDNIDPWHFQKVEELPYWNGGMNHIVLTFSDKYRRLAPTDEKIGNASIMASDMQETMLRPGFDISIPLPGNYHMRQLQPISPLQRKYLLTFRGKRYIGLTDDGIFRSSKEFREMHNGNDVIVATNCDHATNDYHRREHPELGEGCDEDKEVWKKHNSYEDLMNTTFALVPAGRQPSSYRFIEVLAAGSIPVLIADNYVKPFDSLIPWYTCAIQFPTTEIKRIVNTLRKVSPEEKLKRQRNCLEIYNQYLKDDETLFQTAIRALKARFMGALPHLTQVRRR